LGQALVIYIASSPRPMHELLSPNPQDVSKIFSSEFQGMTTTAVTLDELLEARTTLFATVINCLPAKGKEFLLTLNGPLRRTQASPMWRE